MPGDPKECRKRAKRCLALASEASNPVLKDSLKDLAKRWAALATDLEATNTLLEAELASRSSDNSAKPLKNN